MDLHLLSHFDALVRAASVSRAADMVGITQPAMSAALRRLRELLADPVLVRSGRGMAATGRAIDLHREVAPLLSQWKEATEGRAFDADTSTRTFTLVASDYMQYLLLPGLARALRRRAPRTRLRVLPTNPVKTIEMLESGQAEFLIGQVTEPPAPLRRRGLHREVAVCLVRRGHPALEGHWDLEAYVRQRHIQVTSVAYRNFSDAVTKALGGRSMRLDVGLVLPSYLAAPHVVAASDLVATLPKSIAEEFARALPVEMLELPADMPVISISLLWHNRHQADPAHRWLRDLIVATLAPAGDAGR